MLYNPQVFIRAAEIVANREIHHPSDDRDHHMPGCWAIEVACKELGENNVLHKRILENCYLVYTNNDFGQFMFFDDKEDIYPQRKAQNHRVIALLLCAEICNET